VILMLGLALALRPTYICESGRYQEHEPEAEQCDPPDHLARLPWHKGGTSSRGSLIPIFVCMLQANERVFCRQPAKVTANITSTKMSVIALDPLIRELTATYKGHKNGVYLPR
jgi:hypothetical protein